MNIKWYKNYWYYGSLATSVLIVLLAFISANSFSVAIFTDPQTVSIFSVETIYRSLFNPLWAVALWFWNEGQKQNAKRHKDILLNIQGALDSHDEEDMKVSKIYSIVYEYDDIEKRLKKKLSKSDTIDVQSGDPTI